MTDQIVVLPLYEPMYINGQLSPTWAMFFDRLIETINAIGANNGGGIDDLQAMMSVLPNSAISGQQSLIKAITPLVQAKAVEQQEMVQIASPYNQIQQAVDAVELPTSQVITP